MDLGKLDPLIAVVVVTFKDFLSVLFRVSVTFCQAHIKRKCDVRSESRSSTVFPIEGRIDEVTHLGM